ncbi:MAG TPA: helix-turn-helix domain-containing protein [Acidimicrobiales bacterium]|nr:helix-turn-helix domain-containing protein [Acidimicrobiales bacterium]
MTDTAPAATTDATPGPDALREALLDAAAAVFARQGFDGARIQDVVREAGLSTGAVYGRFASKEDLLREAIITRSVPQVRLSAEGVNKVAELVERGAANVAPGLTNAEALLLETFVAARREPEVAEALAEADRRWKDAMQGLVEAATADGTVAPDVDPAAVLFLVRIVRLGLLLHRGSGLPSPDPESWAALVGRVVASFGSGAGR